MSWAKSSGILGARPDETEGKQSQTLETKDRDKQVSWEKARGLTLSLQDT